MAMPTIHTRALSLQNGVLIFLTPAPSFAKLEIAAFAAAATFGSVIEIEKLSIRMPTLMLRRGVSGVGEFQGISEVPI